MMGIKYVSLYEPSGYAVAAQRYLRGLIKRDLPVTWTPMVKGRGWGLGYEPFLGKRIGDQLLDPHCNRDLEYDTVVVHTVPEYFPLWREREAGKRIVGYTVWETDKIPRHWPSALGQADRLMVPSEWNRSVFRTCGVTVPISVVPHIADRTVPPRFAALPDEIRSTDFMFYTIGTWTNRKAVADLLCCYWDTFSADDSTILTIKTTKEDFTRSFMGRFHADTMRTIRRLRRRYESPARICVITRDVDDDVIRGLHMRGDCYVSLCHSEGWGLGAFDAAAFGNPVIITGYGGQLDYLPEDLAYLVQCRAVPVRDRPGRRSYSPDQMWAEPDSAHASRLMRAVVENRDAATEKGALLKRHIEQNFVESAVVELLLRGIGRHA